MSRLPMVEQALLDAARRAEGIPARGDDRPRSRDARPAADARQHAGRRRRRSWGRRPLLATVAGLAVSGVALAAGGALLDNGEPVPGGPQAGRPVPLATGFKLAAVRVADPGGGPAWTIGMYAARNPPPAGRFARFIAANPGVEYGQHERLVCAVVGRTQAGKVGVVGRDGAFGDDGRFHALSPRALVSGQCGSTGGRQGFVSFSDVPPIPASGYTGPSGTRVGGCRERVNLYGPTVSPQTRRRLKGVPVCDVAGLRYVVSGFGGRRARRATLTVSGRHTLTQTLSPADYGAFLFVLRTRPDGTRPRVRLTITEDDGQRCRALPTFVPHGRPDRAAYAAAQRNARICFG